jgi:ribonuclease-3
MDFSKFEKTVGVEFGDKALLRQAFIHRSYLNENKSVVSKGGKSRSKSGMIADVDMSSKASANTGNIPAVNLSANTPLEHNERLEFLGDAVLELISTVFLYKKYPGKHEGDLTSYRSALVNAVTLSGVASRLGMESYLLLSRGEAKDKGKARQIILANTMEALIGAIYLDRGYDVAAKFVHDNVLTMIDEVVASGAFVDAKSHFQEKAQEIEGVTPVYKVLLETGPDHDKSFSIGVFLRNDRVAAGTGKSKQEAEQIAAQAALAAKGW